MTTRLAQTLASLAESGHLLGRLTLDQQPLPSPVARAVAVLRAEGPMGVSALARRCHMAQSTMTEIVQEAEAAGWMRRQGAGMRLRIMATHAGTLALAQQRDVVGAALEPRFKHLAQRERAVLERAALILASGLARDAD